MPTEKIKLLVLCTGNSCRSQIAEGWIRELKSDVIDVWSAGVETHGLNPYAVKVMAEVGVDISTQESTHVNDLMQIPFDYVVTVCDNARESCPIFPKQVTSIHQRFDDPPFLAKSKSSEDEKLEVYRMVRDQIKLYVETLPASLPVKHDERKDENV